MSGYMERSSSKIWLPILMKLHKNMPPRGVFYHEWLSNEKIQEQYFVPNSGFQSQEEFLNLSGAIQACICFLLKHST